MEEKKQLQNRIKIIGIIGSVYLVMKYIVPLIVPFLFGAALVMLIRPMIMTIYQRVRICKGLLGIIIIMVFLGVLSTGIWFLIHNLMIQFHGLWENKEEIIQNYCGTYQYCCEKIGGFFGKEQEEMQVMIETNFSNIYVGVKKNFLPNIMSGSLACIIKGIKFVGVIIIGIISFLLLLKDYDELIKKVNSTEMGQRAIVIGKKIMHGVSAYLRAQGTIMLIIGSICGIALFLTGSSYAILMGVLIGLLDALPFIGTGIILVPWGVFVMIQGNFLQGLTYFGLYLVCSFTREYLEARLIGNKLGVPAFMILVSIYVGVKLFGFGGFFLGPLSYMIIVGILEEEKLEM